MAKKKKDRKKKPTLPPLSLRDKLIYIGIMAVMLAILAVLFYWRVFGLSAWSMKDPRVVAIHERLTSGWLIPLGVYGGITGICVFFTMVYEKKPIFGNPEIEYDHSKWRRVYPIFDKRYSGRKLLQRGEKALMLVLALWLVGALLFLVNSLFGLFGRVVLYEGGDLSVYSVFNQEKEQYTAFDITELALEVKWNSSGRGFASSWYLICECEFVTSDAKTYTFSIGDFRSDEVFLAQVQEIKARLGKGHVRIDGKENLDRFIQDRGCTPEQAALLYELFEMK